MRKTRYGVTGDRFTMASRANRSKPTRKLERHYGVKEAATLLGIPSSSLRTYLAQGLVERIKLPGLRGKVLLSESALIDFLDRHREPAVAEITEGLRRVELDLPRQSKRSSRGRDGNGSVQERGTK